jgi:hypothetical protein
MQDKIAVAEAKSATVNTQIETKVVEKVKLIHDTQVVVQDRIVKEAAQMDAECKVDASAISILNQAAGGKK